MAVHTTINREFVVENKQCNIRARTNLKMNTKSICNFGGDGFLDRAYFIFSVTDVRETDFYIRFENCKDSITKRPETEWIELIFNATTRETKVSCSLDFDFIDTTFSVLWNAPLNSNTGLLTVFLSYATTESKTPTPVTIKDYSSMPKLCQNEEPKSKRIKK